MDSAREKMLLEWMLKYGVREGDPLLGIVELLGMSVLAGETKSQACPLLKFEELRQLMLHAERHYNGLNGLLIETSTLLRERGGGPGAPAITGVVQALVGAGLALSGFWAGRWLQ
jgi:hypothetical protein